MRFAWECTIGIQEVDNREITLLSERQAYRDYPSFTDGDFHLEPETT